MHWLDPKLDVVFKLLFADARNRRLLIALLTAVLKPAVPIDSVDVLNPEVPKALPADRGVVLDLHVRLADGRHIDVEMQSALHAGLTQRFLYYWARLHASQLTIGDHYENLCPTLSILILRDALLPADKAHSVYRVLEVETHHDLCDDLELHFLELAKIALEPQDTQLRRWMQFLLATDEREIDELAMRSPEIREARDALAALSRDPDAQELARQREMALINLKIIKQFERAEGEAKGRAEGEAKGRAEGEAKGRAEGEAKALRLAVQTACDLLAIPIDATRQDAVQQLDVAGLTELLEHLRTHRHWP